MARTKTAQQLAHEIWPRLMVTAESRGTITRRTIAKRFGITGQAFKNFDKILAPLESYCRQHELPPLYALIVVNESDVPGSGTDAAGIDPETVYGYDWRQRTPMIPSEDDFAAVLT